MDTQDGLDTQMIIADKDRQVDTQDGVDTETISADKDRQVDTYWHGCTTIGDQFCVMSLRSQDVRIDACFKSKLALSCD